MIELLPLIVLGFAAFRVTRFLLFDSLIDEPRNWFYSKLIGGTRFGYLRDKALDLSQCSWCAGWWICLIIYSVYIAAYPWQYTRYEWLSVVALAGVQGMLHSYEPNDDD